MLDAVKRATFRAATWAGGAADIRDTIVVAGAPRSGTTWVAELLRELVGYKLFNEPLFLANYPEAREAGFSWRTHIPPGAHQPEAEAYLRKALTGQMPLGPGWHLEGSSALGRFTEHVTQRRMVVKFCRAGRLLRWLEATFDIQGIVLLMRHPCAVIASQLQHGRWDADQLVYNLDTRAAFGEMPDELYDQHAVLLDSLSTRLEVLAAVWCLDYYLPLIEHRDENPPWILMPYERLVTRGEEELERVLDTLNVSPTGSMLAQLHEPSRSAQGDFRSDSEQQLSKWRNRLSTAQIDTVERIVSGFGLSQFYSRDLEPDYDALNSYQCPTARWDDSTY